MARASVISTARVGRDDSLLRRGEFLTMRQLELHAVRKGLLLIICMALLSLAVPVFGQNSSQSGTSTTTTQVPSAQQQSSQKTDTTTTTTRTQTAAGIDPIWFVIGGIALLAILLIVILAARGRSGGSHVHERTTVVKKE